MLSLQALVPERLASELGINLTEARKVHASVVREDFGQRQLQDVRRTTMEKLAAQATIPTLALVQEQKSQLDPFVKYALRTHDDHVIETVRIPLENPARFSVCVSSQVGCALGCKFCATGRMGLTRNLETWEIVEQVRTVRRHLSHGRVHGVVFQGMGEPMANLDRVLEAIDVLREPCGLAIDARNITVCTSGLPAGIRRLAREMPKVRLGLSIGSVRQDKRKRLMPIANAHPFDEVLAAVEEHARLTGLSPMWAVTPLSEVNDSFEDGAALGQTARAFWERTGIRPRLSVIPYNSIGDDDPFQRASDERYGSFVDGIESTGYRTHRRYSGGADVNAACGQLAAR
ncbi:MAG TPA: 23S rRNA (adenine(2503)-C(2))-methyltransferase RlmN [Polyangiales bacterium]|nr:23S rRNA (adenine(2503)-C(2))-methyltransferase RlmN [Polyangiales bacterium]